MWRTIIAVVLGSSVLLSAQVRESQVILQRGEAQQPFAVPKLVKQAVLKVEVLREGDRNICTVFPINRKEHFWLTAAHCVENVVNIKGIVAEVVVADKTRDVTVLRANVPGMKQFRIQPRLPEIGDDAFVIGHPFGWNEITIFSGHVAAPTVPLEGQSFMIIDGVAAPGNSGSPILNEKGEVISILVIGWGRSWSPVTGGVLWTDMLIVSNRYWGR